MTDFPTARQMVVALIEKHGMRQTEIAAKTGLSQGRISQLYSRGREMRSSTFQRLAALYFEKEGTKND